MIPIALTPRPDHGAEQSVRLQAEIREQEMRAARLASLRLAVAASAPLWVHAHLDVLPGIVVWPLVLAAGVGLVLAIGYAVLEGIDRRRLARIDAGPPVAAIHVPGGLRPTVRTGLWHVAAAVSVPAWIAAAIGRPLPRGLLGPLTLVAGVVFALLALASLRSRTTRRDDIQRMYRTRVLAFAVSAVLVAGGLGTAYRTANTLRALDAIEAERDGWQQAGEVLDALEVGDGSVVADLGCGAGYFALKLAPRVGTHGRVLAVDVRRWPLLFLRLRTFLRGQANLTPILGGRADPRLPAGGVDAVLVANTFHELTEAPAILEHLSHALRPGGRIVVVDPMPRDGDDHDGGGHHHVAPETAAAELGRAGFEILDRRDRFIEREGERWWLLTARRPVPVAILGMTSKSP